MNKKLDFNDFITSVSDENQEFVRELHDKLMELGCKIDIKAAKSGYMVSYTYNKRTIANYIFRRKGMFMRIYGVHVSQYQEVLETLPEEMISSIQKAPICKRMADPNDCNPKCSMGYDFWLKDEHYQKCRTNAFMFLVCPENSPFIRTFVLNEVEAWKQTIH